MSTSAASSTAPAQAAQKKVIKVVVAVHGIGDQRRCETVQSVASRFASDLEPHLPIMPLGHFHVANAADVSLSQLGATQWTDNDPRKHVYFVEAYWADIPRDVAKEGYTLEETKAWGRSVVSRAHAAYDRKVRQPGASAGAGAGAGTRPRAQLQHDDFRLAAGVVDEAIETVGVLENLLAVLGKAGIMNFQLAPLLRDFLGDVQLVADFPDYREQIVAWFHRVMESILVLKHKQFPGDDTELQIYIVAHSEGTVVSFLGLLKALSGQRVDHPKRAASSIAMPEGVAPTDWVKHVRAYMTLGSPIDKHLILWPEMWAGLQEMAGQALPGQIKWRNYYDYGDPVGFKLDTARDWLSRHQFQAFDFTDDAEHDIGFSRYVFPGKAHVDYWGDCDVFLHFIDNVVLDQPASRPRPDDRPLVSSVSTAIPYLACLGIHSAGVYLLYKAVASHLDAKHISTWQTFVNVGVLSLLLMAITFGARLPRLTNPRRLLWKLAGAAGFVVLVLPLWLWAQAPDQLPLSDKVLAPTVGPWLQALPGWTGHEALAGPLALTLVALLLASTGWWIRRTARLGRRVLISAGASVTAVLVLLTLKSMSPAAAGAEHPAFWPVVLAFLAYVYLWWLGVLVFDLTFIWHRYIRFSVATQALGAWHQGEDLRPLFGAKRRGLPLKTAARH